MNNRLLFVDDEAHILEGLQDSLRKHRKQWNMTFACGGEAAIAELEDNPFDVIITDMRMPIVDGNDVLRFARQRYPATIRIMLSGYSELEQTIRASSLAHRYLTKPCDQTELEDAVRRSLELANKFDNAEVKKIAGSAGLLPVSSSSHRVLLEQINSEQSSINHIAQLVESDIALTTKMLHLVNSAFFRRQRTIESAREAVTYLGIDIIKSLVFAEHLFSLADNNAAVDKDWFDRLQSHCLLTASIAKVLMRGTEHTEAAFTAGLLHEVGALVLTMERSTADAKPTESLRVDPGLEPVVQSQSVGTAHEELGAYVLSLWGIPGPIVEAVAFHQRPSDLGLDTFNVVGAVHVANHLAELCETTDVDWILEDGLDMQFINSLGLADRLDAWLLDAQSVAADNLTGLFVSNLKRVA